MLKRIWWPVIGYKKVRAANDVEVIATLKIPMFALVYAGQGEEGKQRASRAKVIAMEIIPPNAPVRDGCDCSGCKRVRRTVPGPYVGTATAGHDMDFTYKIGKTVRPTAPFYTGAEQCASGIHFYADRKLAEDHFL